MRGEKAMKKQFTKSVAGFTLIETMIIVVLIGVLAGVTIPAFSKYLQRQKLQGARNELIADIQYARSLAISRRTTFRIAFADDQYQIIQTGPETIMRTKSAPDGVSFNSDADPSFYAWGLSDPANMVINGGCQNSNLTLAPNGTVTYD
jgi:Tfp pilus assembly protein FimT